MMLLSPLSINKWYIHVIVLSPLSIDKWYVHVMLLPPLSIAKWNAHVFWISYLPCLLILWYIHINENQQQTINTLFGA